MIKHSKKNMSLRLCEIKNKEKNMSPRFFATKNKENKLSYIFNVKNNRKRNMLFRRFATICMMIALAGMTAYQDGLECVMAKEDDVVTLRVCNWEEYIDEGGWGEDETISLSDKDIIGENPMYEDFEEWYYDTYHQKVKVEYSCFGTNEELYNMLTLGDEYDIVCPSEYMIMKLMTEDMLVPFSEEFFDESIEENYYIKGVSPFIRNAFETNEINGEPWSKYAAGYMWGITGIIYNPEEVSYEEASTWKIMTNEKFHRRITIKDNVRDAFFGAVGAVKAEKLTSDSFINDPDYTKNLAEEMNDLSPETLETVLAYLQETRENVYSFETDSGKADMISGKVVAGYQWSGDAVYAMDQAQADDFYLNFAVPKESTNLYFDGWVMLKSGIKDDAKKQHAAEAFINYISMPENVVRNMYYIGYTSVISGGDSNEIFDYLNYCYGVEEVEEDVVEYPLGYFFSGETDDADYIILTQKDQVDRQLGAQYPSQETMERSAIMRYFDADENAAVNRMWIDVRCYNVKNVPVYVWIIIVIFLIVAAVFLIRGKIVANSIRHRF